MALRDYLSFWIVLFLLFFNSGAALMDATGTADYLGVDPDTGDTSELKDANSQVQDYKTGTGQGATLFGAYSRLAGVFNIVINAINPGAEMLKAGGVPPPLVNFIFGGLSIIPPLELAFFIRSG